MSLECFFNELSLCPIAANVNDARERMSHFVKTLAQINSVAKKQLPLRVSEEFFNAKLASNYLLDQWRNDFDVNRDIRNYFRSIATKSPLLERGELKERASQCEARCRGELAIGILAAFLSDGLTISISSEPQWDCTTLKVTISEMDGDGKITESEESLRHFAREEHVCEHKDWIGERTAVQFADHAELWGCRATKFPSLEFCEHVQSQITALPWNGPQLKQVIKRLEMLDQWWGDCCRSKLTINHKVTNAPCKLTPESQATLVQFANQHTFMCPDGKRRRFSWHARFTPGAGRIYLTWETEDEKLLIGHIGKHLPTVEHPH